MINLIVLIGTAIAGALIYFAGAEELEKILFIKIQKNLLFPLFLILVLLCGVYITQYIHLSETAAQNSNSQQRVNVMGCIWENAGDCQTNANKLNNDSYAQLQVGTVSSATFYIPFSMSDVLSRNTFTFFIFGIFVSWIIFSFKNLSVKIDG
jgi:hypothetical protein